MDTKMDSGDNKALIGNSFPWSLVRQKLVAEPLTLEQFRAETAGVRMVSFWGHPDTLAAASEFCGMDLTPKVERTVLTLSVNNLPALAGEEFTCCYVISPNYAESFRQPLAPEAQVEHAITGWIILRMRWENC